MHFGTHYAVACSKQYVLFALKSSHPFSKHGLIEFTVPTRYHIRCFMRYINAHPCRNGGLTQPPLEGMEEQSIQLFYV